LINVVNSYIGSNGFGEIAKRYAYNLANGRFLWRNRIGAEQVEVEIKQVANNSAIKAWRFNALSLSLRNFYTTGEAKEALDSLSGIIETALKSESVLFHISAFVRIGRGQEVFPSQELILDTSRSRGGKSRTLYHVNGTAAMHSQKIGNAIRTIDTWYPEAEELGPIAVEPYGSVTTLGKAFRQPKEKIDFYTLLDDWIVGDNPPTIEQQHYVIAVLARGGVFGEKEEE
jgi:CRISPR-associated protein Csy3